MNVLGRAGERNLFKNAVDALELPWSLPSGDGYVVVSGDRDFILSLKALQRRGKAVVGVCPKGAALCDRFVRFPYQYRRGSTRLH